MNNGLPVETYTVLLFSILFVLALKSSEQRTSKLARKTLHFQSEWIRFRMGWFLYKVRPIVASDKDFVFSDNIEKISCNNTRGWLGCRPGPGLFLPLLSVKPSPLSCLLSRQGYYRPTEDIWTGTDRILIYLQESILLLPPSIQG